MKTIPSVPVIVAAANRNGIVAANDSPKTASNTISAIGIEIALDRRLSRDIAGHGLRRVQTVADVVGVALGLGEVQRREDAPVDHAARGIAEGGRLAAGHRGRGLADTPFELEPDACGAVTDLVDDEELAVAAIAEMLLEDRARPLGVGARDGERVRQQRRQLRGGKAAYKQDNEPETENRPAKAQHETGPTGHASTLVSRVP